MLRVSATELPFSSTFFIAITHDLRPSIFGSTEAAFADALPIFFVAFLLGFVPSLRDVASLRGAEMRIGAFLVVVFTDAALVVDVDDGLVLAAILHTNQRSTISRRARRRPRRRACETVKTTSDSSRSRAVRRHFAADAVAAPRCDVATLRRNSFMFTIARSIGAAAAPTSSSSVFASSRRCRSTSSPSSSSSSSRIGVVVVKAKTDVDSAAAPASAASSFARVDARKCAFGALALGAITMASIGVDDGGVFDVGGAAFAADAASGLADNVVVGGDGNELWTLAGGEVPFWANMVKYARFSISIMVGFAYMFGRPVVALMKKPGTAALVIGVGAGGYFFFKFTIETMLGLSDPATMG